MNSLGFKIVIAVSHLRNLCLTIKYIFVFYRTTRSIGISANRSLFFLFFFNEVLGSCIPFVIIRL